MGLLTTKKSLTLAAAKEIGAAAEAEAASAPKNPRHVH